MSGLLVGQSIQNRAFPFDDAVHPFSKFFVFVLLVFRFGHSVTDVPFHD